MEINDNINKNIDKLSVIMCQHASTHDIHRQYNWADLQFVISLYVIIMLLFWGTSMTCNFTKLINIYI